MPNIKKFCRLCHLSLLRLRVAYAAGAVYRMSRRFRMLYDAALSRAFWKLSLLKKNPYMLRAAQEMRENMYEDGCYYCDYWLQTKINHKWASGIVFRYDIGYFSEFLALFSRLLYVFEFYTETVKELRAEVEKLKKPKGQILMLPAPKEFERRVA